MGPQYAGVVVALGDCCEGLTVTAEPGSRSIAAEADDHRDPQAHARPDEAHDLVPTRIQGHQYAHIEAVVRGSSNAGHVVPRA